MKKKKILVVCTVALAISLIAFVYQQIIVKAFRYSTPEEAFSHSRQRDCELMDILKDRDVALQIYKQKDGTYSDSIITKDSRGWTPLSSDHKNKRQTLQDNGFVYQKEVQGKTVIQVVIIVKADEDLPTISDNIRSVFLSGSYELADGEKLLYGFSVSQKELPDNYRIKLGNRETVIS